MLVCFCNQAPSCHRMCVCTPQNNSVYLGFHRRGPLLVTPCHCVNECFLLYFIVDIFACKRYSIFYKAWDLERAVTSVPSLTIDFYLFLFALHPGRGTRVVPSSRHAQMSPISPPTLYNFDNQTGSWTSYGNSASYSLLFLQIQNNTKGTPIAKIIGLHQCQ